MFFICITWLFSFSWHKTLSNIYSYSVFCSWNKSPMHVMHIWPVEIKMRGLWSPHLVWFTVPGIILICWLIVRKLHCTYIYTFSSNILITYTRCLNTNTAQQYSWWFLWVYSLCHSPKRQHFYMLFHVHWCFGFHVDAVYDFQKA